MATKASAKAKRRWIDLRPLDHVGVEAVAIDGGEDEAGHRAVAVGGHAPVAGHEAQALRQVARLVALDAHGGAGERLDDRLRRRLTEGMRVARGVSPRTRP